MDEEHIVQNDVIPIILKSSDCIKAPLVCRAANDYFKSEKRYLKHVLKNCRKDWIHECKCDIKKMPKDPQAISDILSLWHNKEYDDYEYENDDKNIYLLSYEYVLWEACANNNYNIVYALSKLPNPPDPIYISQVLITAAEQGHNDIVRLLLEWPVNAPRADCQNGEALITAVKQGHNDIVRLLLEWPVNAPRADCQNGEALITAVKQGDYDMVRLLLEWPVNAPRADCQNGKALITAVKQGDYDMVRLLLEWPVNAPRADCQNGKALIKAVEKHHLEIARLLLEWPTNAPRADCQNNGAFVVASYLGNYEMLRLLLNSLNAL